MGTIGEYLQQHLEEPSVTGTVVGVNGHKTANEHDFDCIMESLSDAGTAYTTERVSLDSQYGRDDVQQEDVFAKHYAVDDGASLLYVADASRWNDESQTFSPTQGYERFINLLDTHGLDAVLFADVERDMARYGLHPDDCRSHISREHPEKYVSPPIDWLNGNDGDGDTLLLVANAEDRNVLESTAVTRQYDSEPRGVAGTH